MPNAQQGLGIFLGVTAFIFLVLILVVVWRARRKEKPATPSENQKALVVEKQAAPVALDQETLVMVEGEDNSIPIVMDTIDEFHNQRGELMQGPSNDQEISRLPVVVEGAEQAEASERAD
jgi:hypothetical protein